jgi:homogentisate 1,2-dioxygenase
MLVRHPEAMATATFGASARASFTATPDSKDPYRYQVGFGNRFATEAM